MSWGEVDERARRVIICGQGPSWADVDMDALRAAWAAGAYVLAVNGAIEAVPWADGFFTLDHSRDNERRVAEALPLVRYYEAVPDEGGHTHGHVVYLRRVARADPPPRSAPFRKRVRQQIVGGLSDAPGAIHTGNSGFGALGVAYHMHAHRVALLGIDGAGSRRWDGSGNMYLGHMPDLFAGAVRQLRARGVMVVNGSPGSAVECFPRTTPEEALRWVVAPDEPAEPGPVEEEKPESLAEQMLRRRQRQHSAARGAMDAAGVEGQSLSERRQEA